MGCVIIAMPKYEDANRLAINLRKTGVCDDVYACSSGAEVLRTSHEMDVGIVVCARRLKDMRYIELTEYLPSSFNVIVLSPDESIEVIEGRIKVLLQPIKLRDLVGAIEELNAKFYTERKKKKGFRSIVEQRLIDEAKAILMDNQGMTEPEAFRYIQKSSMDNSRTMVESAEMIIMLKRK